MERDPPFKYEIYIIRIARPCGRPKCYVGQSQSHVLNHGKYRPFGARRRLAAHISEAFRHREKECRKLNDAIRCHGAKALCVSLLRVVDTAAEADAAETHYIKVFGAIEFGYNTCLGGRAPPLTKEQRASVSASLTAHYASEEARRAHSVAHTKDDKKFAMFAGKVVDRLRILSLSPTAKTKRVVLGVTFHGGEEFRLAFGSQFQTFGEVRTRARTFLHTLGTKQPTPPLEIQLKHQRVFAEYTA